MTRNCDSMIRCLWFHDITPLHTADFHPPSHVSLFPFHTPRHTPHASHPATYFHCIFCYFSKLAALISFLHPSHLSPHLSPHTPDWSHSVWHKIISRGCLQCMEIMTWCNLQPADALGSPMWSSMLALHLLPLLLYLQMLASCSCWPMEALWMP